MTDITYIRTHEGWPYLAVVVDLFSRQVVGWSMGGRIDTGRVLDALVMALCLARAPVFDGVSARGPREGRSDELQHLPGLHGEHQRRKRELDPRSAA